MMFHFQTIPDRRLDPIDDMILQGVQEGKTLKELGEEVGRSFAGVRLRMKALKERGYIRYNEGKARARMLTPLATEYLKVNGLLKQDTFQT